MDRLVYINDRAQLDFFQLRLLSMFSLRGQLMFVCVLFVVR